MDKWLSFILAAGAVLGGVDRMIGNRFGFGARFEEAFHLLGPTALSMAGILCLCPLMARFFQTTLAPFLCSVGLDPAILGGMLAIDMGGFQLSQSLARSPAVGILSGITIAATFGCTFSFTIPVGCGMLHGACQNTFLQGILIGFPSLLVSLIIGGLLAGVDMLRLAATCLPFFLFCIIFWLLSLKYAAVLIRLLQRFAQLLQIIATVGLVVGAIDLLTGFSLLHGFMPLKDALNVCSEICVSLLGSLPLAEVLRKILCQVYKRFPCLHLLSVDGLCAALFVNVSLISTLSVLHTLPQKEQRIVSACYVCGASALPHIGYILAVAPEHTWVLVASKFSGFLFAFIFAICQSNTAYSES